MYKDKILLKAAELEQFTIKMICNELNLPYNRLEQMTVAEILKSAGYVKRQVRFDSKTLRVVWSFGSKN